MFSTCVFGIENEILLMMILISFESLTHIVV